MKLAGYLFVFILFLGAAFGSFCGTYQDSATLITFQGGAFLRNPAQYSTPSTFTYQGLKWSLTNNAQITASESTGNVVFTLGAYQSTACSTSNRCVATMQNDGNFVIYTGVGGAVWGSATCYWQEGPGCVGPASYIQLLSTNTSGSYFTLIDSNCTVVWPYGSNKPSVNKARTTTVLGYVNSGSTTIVQGATAAPKWKYQFSVNSHISQGWSTQLVRQLTHYLGVGCIRDSIPSPSNDGQGTIWQDYVAMNANGVKLDVGAGGVPNISGLAQQVNAWANFTKYLPGMLQSIEGFNEVNNFGFTYNGVNPSSSYAGYLQAQRDLYSLVKANASLKSLPVYDLTGFCGFAPDTYSQSQCSNLTGRADRTNLHIYPNNGDPLVSLGNSNDYLTYALDGYGTTPSNNVVTETGYHTDTFPNGITETSAGKLIVNMMLDYIRLGNLKAFIYELIDETWNGYIGQESHFGLFRNSSVNYSAKPAAIALHFLSYLLNDAGAGLTTALNYTITNYPYTMNHQVFLNSKGVYYIAFWTDLPVYNPNTMADITNAATTVTLNINGQSASKYISVYDIFSAQNDSMPLVPLSSSVGTSTTFSISDKAVVVAFGECHGQDSVAFGNSYSSNNYITTPIITSLNCMYGLYFSNTTGQLQIKYSTTIIWSSPQLNVASYPGGPYKAPYSLNLQNDGNMVIYSSDGRGAWGTSTGWAWGYSGNGGWTLQLGSDGILRVIDVSGYDDAWWQSYYYKPFLSSPMF